MFSLVASKSTVRWYKHRCEYGFMLMFDVLHITDVYFTDVCSSEQTHDSSNKRP